LEGGHIQDGKLGEERRQHAVKEEGLLKTFILKMDVYSERLFQAWKNWKKTIVVIAMARGALETIRPAGHP